METEVVIIGCGPTGATLGGLLAKRGVRVTVIEKSLDVFPQPRAAHIDHTGLRTMQELGFLDAILPAMVHNQSLDLVNHEHELLMRLPAGQKSVSGLPSSVYFYQPDLDRTLRSTIASIPGLDLRLGHEMLSFAQDGQGVRVNIQGPHELYTLRTQWLVGCDGSWSPVREAMGSKLSSLGFDERWLVLDLQLQGPHERLPVDRVVQVCDPHRPHLTTPISTGRQRFEFMLLHGDDPDTMTSQDSTSA